MKKPIAFALAGVMFVGACAQTADSVAPSYVSRNAYTDLTCKQLTAERNAVVRNVTQLSEKQNSAAANDKAAVAVGIILFWPALFYLAADDSSEQLGLAKGQYDAITDRMVDKGRKVPPEPAEQQKP